MALWKLPAEEAFYFPSRPDVLLVKISGNVYRRMDGKPFPSGLMELEGVSGAEVVPLQQSLPWM